MRSDVPLPGIDAAEVDPREDARERGERAAEREDEGERLPDVDPEGRDHRAVLDSGPDDQPHAREAEERDEADENDHRHGDLDEAVIGDVRAEDGGRVEHPVGHGEDLRIGAPDPEDERPQREREPDRDEHLLDRTAVERTDEDEFDESPERRADRETERRGREELPLERRGDLRRQPPRRVGAEGDERAVREVEDAHQPVDERQPGGDEEVHRAEPEPRDREQDERAQCPAPCTPRSCWTRCGVANSSSAAPS